MESAHDFITSFTVDVSVGAIHEVMRMGEYLGIFDVFDIVRFERFYDVFGIVYEVAEHAFIGPSA
jgi:hypothetical protein